MESESWQSPKSLKKLTLQLIVKSFISHLDQFLLERELSNHEILSLFHDRIFPAIEELNTLIPREVRLRKFFQRSIKELTESVILYTTVGYSYHLFYFFIQFLMLDEVFIGNNFFKTSIDNFLPKGRLLVVVPGNRERAAILLIESCSSFQVSKLTLMVYLCPNIIEAVLKKSPNLTELKLSSMNICNEVMISIGQLCPNLKKLHIEELPSYRVSVDGVMKGFFKTATTFDNLKNSFNTDEELPVSFPHLQLFMCEVMKNVFSHQFGIFYYYYYACKSSLTNLRLFGESYVQNSLLQLLERNNVILKLKEIGFSKNILYELLPSDLQLLVNYLPDIEDVNLYVELNRNYPMIVEKSIENFKYLLLRYAKVTALSIMYRKAGLHNTAGRFLSASLSIVGVKLVTIAIAIAARGSVPLLVFLQEVFNSCPSLLELIVFVKDKIRVNFRPIIDGTFTVPINILHKFYLRESNPESDNCRTVQSQTSLWIKMIEIIQSSSPHLSIFGTTFYRWGRFIVEHLSSDVSTFYLFNDPICRNNLEDSEKFASSHLIQMVHRFPNLKFLYLQNMGHSDFIAVRDHFMHTDLLVIVFNAED